MILPVLSNSLRALGFLFFLSSFSNPVRGQTDLSRISQEDMKTVEQRADLLTAVPDAHTYDGQINNWTAGLEGLFQKAAIPLPAFTPSWERLMAVAAQRDQVFPTEKTVFGNTFSQMLPQRLGATGAYRPTTERLVSMAFGLVDEAARHHLTLSLEGLLLSLDPTNPSASALYNPLYGWTAKTLVLVLGHHQMLRFNGGRGEEEALALAQGGFPEGFAEGGGGAWEAAFDPQHMALASTLSPSCAPDGTSKEDAFEQALRVATDVWGQLRGPRTVEEGMQALPALRGLSRKFCQQIFENLEHAEATGERVPASARSEGGEGAL